MAVITPDIEKSGFTVSDVEKKMFDSIPDEVPMTWAENRVGVDVRRERVMTKQPFVSERELATPFVQYLLGATSPIARSYLSLCFLGS